MRTRKYRACRLLRQVRPNSNNAICLAGDRLPAESSPYDLLWGIGYRANNSMKVNRSYSAANVCWANSADRETSLPQSHAATGAPPTLVSSGWFALR